MPPATFCVLSFCSFGGICETVSCPVRDLSSPRVDKCASCLVRELTSPRDIQSASWQSASWRIRELSSYQEDYLRPSEHIGLDWIGMIRPPFGHNTRTSQTGETGQTKGQRSHSIGRTVLQTVAQKPTVLPPFRCHGPKFLAC